MDTLSIYARPSLLAAKELLESVALPSSDLTEQHLEHFLYCGPADEFTGLVGLEIYGPHALWVRSRSPRPRVAQALGRRS
jgi:hypothetical protein